MPVDCNSRPGWRRLGQRVWVWLALGFVGLPIPARSQSILEEALSTFPSQTVSLQYSNPSQLRTLASYNTLRERYMGASLQRLENSLAKLGIHEADIRELVLAWQPSQKKLVLEGIAEGRFDGGAVARQAAAQGVPATVISGQKVYCLGPEAGSSCVTVLQNSLGAFGTQAALQGMFATRSGQAPSLSANTQVTGLLNEAQGQAPIWGIAVGDAVSKWFRTWMPGQKNLQLDWATTFKDVQSLAYRIQAARDISLEAKLNCTTPQAAQTLRQVLDGLKLFQSIAWQNMYPNQANPFKSVVVEARESQVTFNLTADYATLAGARAVGMP